MIVPHVSYLFIIKSTFLICLPHISYLFIRKSSIPTILYFFLYPTYPISLSLSYLLNSNEMSVIGHVSSLNCFPGVVVGWVWVAFWNSLISSNTQKLCCNKMMVNGIKVHSRCTSSCSGSLCVFEIINEFQSLRRVTSDHFWGNIWS